MQLIFWSNLNTLSTDLIAEPFIHTYQTKDTKLWQNYLSLTIVNSHTHTRAHARTRTRFQRERDKEREREKSRPF